MPTPQLSQSRRIRRTPYSQKVEQSGVSAFTVYNHMLLPTIFRSLEEDYHHLKSSVQIWDVSCQRQVEVRGSDAGKLVEKLTPRDLTNFSTDRILYCPIINHKAGILNDPVLIKLADDRFWISTSDSDILLWVAGLAEGCQLDVSVFEPEVYPLAVQGPKSPQLMEKVFGHEIHQLKFFDIRRFNYGKSNFLISNSGFSKQKGYEIYLEDPERGHQLWDSLFEAGSDLDVRAGAPNLIERIEAGLLSYGNDMTIENNPLECGLEKFCNVGVKSNFIGSFALKRLVESGPSQIIRSFSIEGGKIPFCTTPFEIYEGNHQVGKITSASFSPDFDTNVALGMIANKRWTENTELQVRVNGSTRSAFVRSKPFL